MSPDKSILSLGIRISNPVDPEPQEKKETTSSSGLIGIIEKATSNTTSWFLDGEVFWLWGRWHYIGRSQPRTTCQEGNPDLSLLPLPSLLLIHLLTASKQQLEDKEDH